MTKSSVSRRQSKPKKPYPEFPLSIHQSGRWFKKFKGKFHYFGALDDWQSAFEKYEREWPHIIQGEIVPPAESESESENGATVADICNKFLNKKKPLLDSGALSPRTFEDFYSICEKIVSTFGEGRVASDLRPEDFGRLRSAFALVHGPHRLTKDITVTKRVFRREVSQLDLDDWFDKPSRKSIRRARNAAGLRMFEPDEIRLILDALDGNEVSTIRIDDETGEPEKVKLEHNPVLKAMVLLSINAGLGNTDVATIPQSTVDLETGWLDFPRAKTEIRRRVPLWPETLEALRIAITKRPKPADKGDADLCFVTKNGRRWVRTQRKANSDRMTALDALGHKFRKLLDSLDINGRRNFYGLRHSFQTVAEECLDLSAVKHCMGHVDDSMSAVYRERISDGRLRSVVNVVHDWLWPKSDEPVESE